MVKHQIPNKDLHICLTWVCRNKTERETETGERLTEATREGVGVGLLVGMRSRG